MATERDFEERLNRNKPEWGFSRVSDRATKHLRATLKENGYKLVRLQRFAVVREADCQEMISDTLNKVRLWEARQAKDGTWKQGK